MLTNDRIGGLLLLAFSVAYGLLTFDIPLLPFQAQAAFTARTMPEALSVLGIVLSLTMIIKPSSNARPDVAGFLWGRGAIICLVMVIYGLTVRPGGFLISTSLFLMAGILILGERRWWLVLIASVPVVVFFWVLMTQLLGVFIEPWPVFLRG
ncbi:tripartite tricarboxylate transporter TctB family protein [Denitrobaculum tricleocarpae]|uniref:Tripartite tricarboxylate transporter TctB family protein n=1 Tax=Denitrobaculum tricleocarpae TaxID=2591009 RepID=A0A545TPB7_9PROT|nr:tripartite tricarboxylate transporter TctB family protein [Denitrobaculum tricleocarpae]TQV79066.1 tripartite tricarboxylate transporter TctB family protein [Denitrobaculum tricleocarpae]